VSRPGRGFSRYDLGLVTVWLIWGANYSVAKMAVAQVSPAVFAGLRFLLSTVLLWIIVWAARLHGPIPRRTVFALLAWGVVGHTLNQLSLLSGLRLTTATNSALIFGSLPVVVALLSYLLGHERPSPRVWLGIVLGTVGVITVVGAKGFHFGDATWKGDALSVLALLFWAIFTVGLRRSAMGLNSAQVAALTHLGGTPGLLLLAAPELATMRFSALHPAVWVGLLFSSIFASVVAQTLWTSGLKALGGSRTALYNCLTPLFAVVAAWALLGERPVALQGLGAGLVVIGVFVSRPPAEVLDS